MIEKKERTTKLNHLIVHESQQKYFHIGHTPLLWLVLAIIIGYSLAFGVVLALSAKFLIISGFIIILTSYGYTFSKNYFRQSVWSLLFLSGGICIFWGYAVLRQQSTTLEDFAPREAQLDIRIEKYFTGSKNSLQIKGIGIIQDTQRHLKKLIGQKIYFSLYKNDFSLPNNNRDVRLSALGKIEPLSTAIKGKNSFKQYLQNIGTSIAMQPGEVTALVARPNRLDQELQQLRHTLLETLSVGADSETEKHLSGISQSMLLGDRNALTKEQKHSFSASGSMHLFAVSGLHIGILASAIAFSLRPLRFPSWLQACLGIGIISIFVATIGFPPSAVRAGLMILFFWLASALLRRPAPLSALLASAVVVLLIDPTEILSPGFQLSYAVVAGILVYGLPLNQQLQQSTSNFLNEQAYLRRIHQGFCQRILKGIITITAISFTAFLFSLPLLIQHFKFIVLGSWLINILLVPLASVAISLGFITIGLGVLGLNSIVTFINPINWSLNAILEMLANQASLWTQQQLTVSFPHPIIAIVLELFLFIMCTLIWQFKKRFSAIYLLPPCIIFVLIYVLT